MFNMIKSWDMFNEVAHQKIYDDNLLKYKYTEDDYRIVEKIRSSKEEIEKEYGFVVNFTRFDEMGNPFIDIMEKVEGTHNFFAAYNIKDRKFSMWYVKKLEETCDTCVFTSEYKWSDITSITPNMIVDNGYYLDIRGDFFDELERVYYIYYQDFDNKK